MNSLEVLIIPLLMIPAKVPGRIQTEDLTAMITVPGIPLRKQKMMAMMTVPEITTPAMKMRKLKRI